MLKEKLGVQKDKTLPLVDYRLSISFMLSARTNNLASTGLVSYHL